MKLFSQLLLLLVSGLLLQPVTPGRRLSGVNPTVQAEELVSDPFWIATPTFATTYYVGADIAGASNSNDGLSPTFTGGVNGPWLNLNQATLRAALSSCASTGLRVYVRSASATAASTYAIATGAGTYGTNGLGVCGGGTDTLPVQIEGYPGDARPILNGGECYTDAQAHEVATMGTLDGVPFTITVRQVLNASGRHVRFKHLEVRCGFRHDIQMLGKHVSIEDVVMYGAYEDSVKGVLGTTNYRVVDSDISGFSSQAIDTVSSDYGLFSRNTIHDPIVDPTTGLYDAVVTGAKGGVDYMVVSRNVVYSMPSDGNHQVFSIGGAPNVGVDEQDPDTGLLKPSASHVFVMSNTVTGFYGAMCAFNGGVDSECSDNLGTGIFTFATVGTDADVRAGDSGYAVQPYARNATLRRNRLTYAPVDCASPALGKTCGAINVRNTLEAVGLTTSQNTYYSTGGASPQFNFGGILDLIGFRSATGTEGTSSIVSTP